MIHRTIETRLKFLLSKFPVVTLTGTRQCGKSTLLKEVLPDYKYLSLEDPDILRFAKEDPRGFLKNYGSRTIIDEAQNSPELFSYIQTMVDAVNEEGMYVLSGSNNFLLLEKISQSLAGRTAVMHLDTFSIKELSDAGILPESVDNLIWTGGYPRIYDKRISPLNYFPSYIQTYVERDVRLIRNIVDQSAFVRFLRLCAGRTGQILNISSLAADADIDAATAKDWLSILEAGFVITLIQPYHKNFNKRIIKSPKLYFNDTGLAAHLLGIGSAMQASTHYLHGGLFKNLIISDIRKNFLFAGMRPSMCWWRDSNGNEIDLLIETGEGLKAFEIKSTATLNSRHFDSLHKFASLVGMENDDLTVIYGGEADLHTSDGNYISWKHLFPESILKI